MNRALLVPDSDAATSLTLPIDADRASKFLSFDAAGNVQASAVSPSGATGIVDSIQGFIEVPVDKTYTLDLKAPFAYVVTSLAVKTSGGTCTADLEIDGTGIAGITGVSVGSTETAAAATGANAVAPGQTLDLVISGGASPADLAFTVAISRAI